MFLAQRENAELTQENFVLCKDLDGAREKLASGEADYFLWEKYMTSPLVQNGEFTMTSEVAAPWPAFVFVSQRGEPVGVDYSIFKDALIECVSDYLQNSREELIDGIGAHFNLRKTETELWLNEVKYYDGNNYWIDRLTAAVIIMQSKNMIQSQPELWQMI